MRRRDRDGFARHGHPDVEGVSYLMSAEGTVYRGHEGMRQFVDDVFTVFPDWHPEVVEVTDLGGCVVAEVRMAGTAAASGLPIEQTAWQVVEYRDGKLTRWRGYGSRAEALAAAEALE